MSNPSILHLSRISQTPITASPSVLERSCTQSGSVPPAASHVFAPHPDVWSTPDQPILDPKTQHWFSSTGQTGSAADHELCDASHDVVRPSVGISPIVAEPPLSSINVDVDTRIKRLYASVHTPMAPPPSPVTDLLCDERVLLSSNTDSDYPPECVCQVPIRLGFKTQCFQTKNKTKTHTFKTKT